MENHDPQSRSKAALLVLRGAFLTMGCLAIWNLWTLHSGQFHQGLLPLLPFELYEQFLALWLVAGVAWLCVLIAKFVGPVPIGFRACLVCLSVCMTALLINLLGWMKVVVNA